MKDEEFDFHFEKSKSLQVFLSSYPNAEECYRDYALRMTRKFETKSPVCGRCLRGTDSIPWKATWRIRFQNRDTTRKNYLFLLLALAGHIHFEYAEVKFETNHGTCAECASVIRIERFLLAKIPHALVAIALGSAAVCLFTLLYIVMMKFYGDPVNADAVTACLISSSTTLLSLWLIPFAYRMSVPSFIRCIAKSPITLEAFVYRGPENRVRPKNVNF